MPNKPRVCPFSCGTHFSDWESSNCDRCKKGAKPEQIGWPTCEIQISLWSAFFSDGTIPAEIAQRMNYTSSEYVWCCGEYAATEDWKAEFKLLYPERFAV